MPLRGMLLHVIATYNTDLRNAYELQWGQMMIIHYIIQHVYTMEIKFAV